jgi:hypothetical protein
MFNLVADLELAGQKIETFLENVINGEAKVVNALNSVSAPTKAVILSIVNDAVKVAASAAAAVAAGEAFNIPATISLGTATIAGIQQLIGDAKAGEAQAVADLAALGIKL